MIRWPPSSAEAVSDRWVEEEQELCHDEEGEGK